MFTHGSYTGHVAKVGVLSHQHAIAAADCFYFVRAFFFGGADSRANTMTSSLEWDASYS